MRHRGEKPKNLNSVDERRPERFFRELMRAGGRRGQQYTSGNANYRVANAKVALNGTEIPALQLSEKSELQFGTTDLETLWKEKASPS